MRGVSGGQRSGEGDVIISQSSLLVLGSVYCFTLFEMEAIMTCAVNRSNQHYEYESKHAIIRVKSFRYSAFREYCK